MSDEIPYDDAEDASGVARINAWLVGNSDELLSQASSRTGLSIKIEGDVFTEIGTSFDGIMFDIDGVQVNDYNPMAGVIQERNGMAFLAPEGVPEWADAKETNDFVLRYDDGDTKVADNLRKVGNYLVRQISVVTDEAYLERIILAYGPINQPTP